MDINIAREPSPENVEIATEDTHDIDLLLEDSTPQIRPKKKVTFKRSMPPIREEQSRPRTRDPPREPRREPPRREMEPEELDEDELLEFAHPNKLNAFESDSEEEQDQEEPEQEEHQLDSSYTNPQETSSDNPSPGFSSINDEKESILKKLVTLERKGLRASKQYNMMSDIDEMRQELKRLVYAAELENSLKFSKKMLMACVTGIEFLNKKFDPFDIELDGWSEAVMGNVDDYDNVFERLHEKYGDKVKVAPEIELIFMVGGSAFMFHLTNTLFKTKLPNMEHVMKQNPDLLKNIISGISGGGAAPPSQIKINQPPPVHPIPDSGRREMRGPELNILKEKPTTLTNASEQEISDAIDGLSDLESLTDSVIDEKDLMKDIVVNDKKKKRRRSKKKEANEISL